ncbi:MAG TPA: leucyl aminopeptidase, partial [Vampirovibrionales bacterium]
KEVEKALNVVDGVLLARELVAEPPNVVNPEYLAKVSQKVVKDQKDSGLTVKVLSKAQCEQLKMEAFLSVGRGSINEPKFIHFHYKPKGKAKKHIAFVGKGVTFDSGGLSLKPPKAMEKMKYDMAGSASVIGLMSIISKLKPQVEVTAVVAACENMPSGNAYRPGDVIGSMAGKTIEVNNTDAEGRVTLADSVFYACKQKPDVVIDIATLTGAIVVALGEAAAGLMTNDQKVADELKNVFAEVGENVWQMPMYDDYEESVTKSSTIADMLNAGSGGLAGSQNGAMFIKQFVGETPWVHLDIAGVCWPEKRDTSLTPRGNPSGFAVLSFARYLESLS